VLQRLQDHNLFLKPEKCSFEQEKSSSLVWSLKKEKYPWIQLK
jgi:hypothetical protein